MLSTSSVISSPSPSTGWSSLRFVIFAVQPGTGWVETNDEAGRELDLDLRRSGVVALVRDPHVETSEAARGRLLGLERHVGRRGAGEDERRGKHRGGDRDLHWSTSCVVHLTGTSTSAR